MDQSTIKAAVAHAAAGPPGGRCHRHRPKAPGARLLINDILRRMIASEHLEADLRRIIREEIRAADRPND
jgi:hypothetical protein